MCGGGLRGRRLGRSWFLLGAGEALLSLMAHGLARVEGSYLVRTFSISGSYVFLGSKT